MVNAWFIIGHANFGKSAIVRALTGVGNARPQPELGFSASLINVDYQDPLQGTHQTLVLASALQEAIAPLVSLPAAVLRELSHDAHEAWAAVWYHDGKTNPGMEITDAII
ncbi:MAG: hypothetical protein LC634_03930, partial [Sphingomonadales bacterium]|nr:hypothetical protein [Sphingomonadales bacterium]